MRPPQLPTRLSPHSRAMCACVCVRVCVRVCAHTVLAIDCSLGTIDAALQVTQWEKRCDNGCTLTALQLVQGKATFN